MKNRTWILIFSALALISLFLGILFLHISRNRTTVQVIQDSKVLYEIDLSKVKEPYTIDIEAKNGGTNRIEVAPGRIRVINADCPDRVCVHQGWLEDQAYPIVCMPHKLMIRLKTPSDTAPDAVSR